MFTSAYPLYTIHFPKYWLVEDRPNGKVYSPTSENPSYKKMLFHVSAGDYITTLASVLRFFQEAIYDKKITPEMKKLQKKIILNVIDDLLYLDKGYTIVPKDRPTGGRLNENI